MKTKEPPPINYATHPRRSTQLASRGTATISSTAARNFSLASALSAMTSPPRSSRSAPGSVIPIDPAWLESIIRSTDAPPVTQPTPAIFSIMDGRDDSPNGQDHSVNFLASALDGLSIDDHPVQSPAALSFPAPTSPAPPSPSGSSSIAPVPTPSRRRPRKFYSVTIGKCCGVFQQWSYVKTLVDGVSGATFTGFRIYDDAIDDYFEAKAAGLVRVVRNPGDELVYGPLSMAIM